MVPYFSNSLNTLNNVSVIAKTYDRISKFGNSENVMNAKLILQRALESVDEIELFFCDQSGINKSFMDIGDIGSFLQADVESCELLSVLDDFCRLRPVLSVVLQSFIEKIKGEWSKSLSITTKINVILQDAMINSEGWKKGEVGVILGRVGAKCEKKLEVKFGNENESFVNFYGEILNLRATELKWSLQSVGFWVKEVRHSLLIVNEIYEKVNVEYSFLGDVIWQLGDMVSCLEKQVETISNIQKDFDIVNNAVKFGHLENEAKKDINSKYFSILDEIAKFKRELKKSTDKNRVCLQSLKEKMVDCYSPQSLKEVLNCPLLSAFDGMGNVASNIAIVKYLNYAKDCLLRVMENFYPLYDSLDEYAEFKFIITHNHPSGYSLSPGDLQFFLGHRLKKICAVSRSYVFVLINSDPWGFKHSEIKDLLGLVSTFFGIPVGFVGVDGGAASRIICCQKLVESSISNSRIKFKILELENKNKMVVINDLTLKLVGEATNKLEKYVAENNKKLTNLKNFRSKEW